MLAKDERHHEPRQPEPQGMADYVEVLQHLVLEMMASILVTYSVVYMPESGLDYLKQYVGSLTIFAVIVTMKDAYLFFPDATPMTTVVLYAASLYTLENGATDWADIAGRLVGQGLGCGVVFGLVYANKDAVLEHSLIASRNGTVPLYNGDALVHSLNEGIATMLEGAAIAFATIPLVGVYESMEGIQSKSEMIPPSGRALCIVGLSLGLIHYVLERLFQTTMSPLATMLQYSLRGEWHGVWQPVLAQLGGLALACAYVHWCSPSKKTLEKVRSVMKRG